MSFLTIPFGSYGLPRNDPAESDSKQALAILYQMIGYIIAPKHLPYEVSNPHQYAG